MKSLAAVTILAAIAALPLGAQPGPQPDAGSTGPVCIPLDDSADYPVKHTKVLDPRTILFYTRDGRVWKNTLKAPCPGLMFHGFSFVALQNEICSNAQAIRVIVTGETCTLGVFTPYTPASPAAP